MRIHTDTLSPKDLFEAAEIARATLTYSLHGSRQAKYAFEVTLRGESRRRPNSGKRGAADDYAATWDQWGVFLGVLFDRDNNMSSRNYENMGTFDLRTNYRFMPEGDNRSAHSPYWPEDAHGDHTFRYNGTPRQSECTKCTAVQTW